MPPAISVVIPSYNRASLIPETLDSILGQSLPPAEVIVVDDGSKDDTAAVLARYGERIQVLAIPNSGELVARNTGIRQARGALIAFCDSDDLWQPEHLASMAQLWAEEPRTTASFANFRIVRDGEWSATDKFADAPAGFWDGLRGTAGQAGWFDAPIIPRLIGFMPFFPSAMVISAAVLREIGGWDEAVNRKVSMDLATTLRLAELPPIGISFAPTVGIRKHARNFSGDVQAMNLGDAAILDYVLRTRPGVAPHAGLIRASIRRRRIAALETAFVRRDFTGLAEIAALLAGESLPPTTRLKTFAAGLPEPLRGAVVAALLVAGSARAKLAR